MSSKTSTSSNYHSYLFSSLKFNGLLNIDDSDSIPQRVNVSKAKKNLGMVLYQEAIRG